MKEAFAGRRVCLLFDNENAGTVLRARRVVDLIQALGAESRLIVNIGRNSTPNLDKLFSERASTVTKRAPAGKDTSDVILATYSGICLGRALDHSEFDGVVLASNDKKLALTVKEWASEGLLACVITGLEKNLRYYFGVVSPKVFIFCLGSAAKRKTPTTPNFEPSKYDYVYEEKRPEVDCLEVLKVPITKEPLPRFIVLPVVGREVTLGRDGSDISLRYWDSESNSLYSPHSFFGLASDGWYLRSAHGMRRVRREARIDGRDIVAAEGNLMISDGATLQLSGFKFRYHKSQLILHRSQSGSTSVAEQVAYVELFLHQLMQDVLSAKSLNWYESFIPQNVRDECEEVKRQQNSDAHPFSFTYLKHIPIVLASNWELFLETPLHSVWRSKTQMKSALGNLNTIRNKLAHPTRPMPTPDEETFVARLAAVFSRR